jgi:hypothetical protein
MSIQRSQSTISAQNNHGDGEADPQATQLHNDAAASTSTNPRRMRSLVLAWHDEESGDELQVNVRGTQQFLEGLKPLGFVPLGEQPNGGVGQRLPAVHPAGDLALQESRGIRGENPEGNETSSGHAARTGERPASSESADHRVRWTVRLARPWNRRRA